MSRQELPVHTNDRTQQLLQGPLKHIKAAALAAALVPLASVTASPAHAQTCTSGGMGFSGYVWNDANHDGVQDSGEGAIPSAIVSVAYGAPEVTATVQTDGNGQYWLWLSQACAGTYTLGVQAPNNTIASPTNAAADDIDSDGADDGEGNSVVVVETLYVPQTVDNDFGFYASAIGPVVGTGTPGYWKTHPEAWPASVVVGGVTYTRDQALSWLLNGADKDKTVTLFASLVSAKLNVAAGTNPTCVQSTIVDADAWMAAYGPVGKGVKASSLAWKLGEPLHRIMDNYNNGMLCAPHRN